MSGQKREENKMSELYTVKIELGSITYEDIEADSQKEAKETAWTFFWESDYENIEDIVKYAKVTVTTLR